MHVQRILVFVSALIGGIVLALIMFGNFPWVVWSYDNPEFVPEPFEWKIPLKRFALVCFGLLAALSFFGGLKRPVSIVSRLVIFVVATIAVLCLTINVMPYSTVLVRAFDLPLRWATELLWPSVYAWVTIGSALTLILMLPILGFIGRKRSNDKGESTTSVFGVGVGVVCQIGAISLVTLAIMYGLRGKDADTQVADRFREGGKLDEPIDAFIPDSRSIPVKPQWNSIQQIVADAPTDELEEMTFKFENAEFTIDLPKGSTIEDRDGAVFCISPTEAEIKLSPSYVSLQMLKDVGGFQTKRVHYLKDELLIVEADEETDERFKFHSNLTMGPFNLFAEAWRTTGSTNFSSKANCLRLVKCLQSIKLKEPEPENIVEWFNLIGARASTNDNGEVIELDCRDAPIGPAVFKKIATLPSIQSLSIASYDKSSDQNLSVLGKLPNLTSFRNSQFSGNKLDHDDMKYLCQCTQLTQISIDVGSMVSTDIAQLNNLTNLQELTLRGFYAGQIEEGLSRVTDLKKLRSLSLQWISAGFQTASTFHFLSKMESLELFIIDYCDGVNDEAVISMQPPEALQELQLRETVITDKGLAHIGTFASLQRLNLSADDPSIPGLTDEGVSKLGQLSNLVELTLYDFPMGDKSAAEFVKMTKLETLTIDGGTLTDDGLMNLAKLPSLTRLEIRDCEQLTEEAVNKFKAENESIILTVN